MHYIVALLLACGSLELSRPASAAPVPPPAAAAGDPAAITAAELLLDREIKPMLEGRNYEARVEGREKGATIFLSGPNGGNYEIYVGADVKRVPKVAPAIELYAPRQLRSRLNLPVDWTDYPVQALNRVRGMLQADPDMHPMNTPKGLVKRPTPFQKEALAELLGYQRALLLFPPGTGKTVVAGLLAKALASDGKPVIVVFVVQNVDLLDQASKTLPGLMEIEPHEVRTVYGTKAEKQLFDADARLILASRSAAFREIDHAIEAAEALDGHVLWVFDEAHHIGRSKGQFLHILDRVKASLRPQDYLLGLTATPWHTDHGAIQSIFDNHVVTAFVTPEERAAFLASGRLIELARLSLFRAMEAGYLAVISSFHEIQYRDEGERKNDFLMDSVVQRSRLAPPDERAVFRREWHAHLPFVERMLREIKETLQVVDGRVTYYDRAMKFVPSIALAEIYADLLNKLTGSSIPIRTRAYHSDLTPEERKEALAWFFADVPEHRHLIVIATLGEAFDHTGVNRITLARRYSHKDNVGLRELMQHLGRAVRIGSYKTRVTVSDYGGAMRRLLLDGVDPALLDAIIAEGGERPPPTPKPKRFDIIEAVTNIQRLHHGGFSTEQVVTPPDLTSPPNDTERPWTLARLLLDGRVIPHFLAHLPLTPRGRYRPLAYYLCQRLEKRPTGKEEADHAGRLLLDALGLTEAYVRESGIAEDLLSHCGRRVFATPREGKRLREIEEHLAAAGQKSLGRVIDLHDRDFARTESLFTRLPLIPNTGITPASAYKWTRAQVLLDPLIPGLLGSKAPNLATYLLERTSSPSECEISALSGVKISYLARLAAAHSYGLLETEPKTWIYDHHGRHLSERALTLFEPSVFDASTAFTDQDLFTLARGDQALPEARLAADAYLVMRGFDPRNGTKIKTPDWSKILAAAPPQEAPVAFSDWAKPWNRIQILNNPSAPDISRGHAQEFAAFAYAHPELVRRKSAGSFTRKSLRKLTFVMDYTPEEIATLKAPVERFTNDEVMIGLTDALKRRDAQTFGRLADYLDLVSPIPKRSRPQVAVAPTDWTLARLILHPRTLGVLMPGKNFAHGSLRFRNVAEFLCDHLRGKEASAWPSEKAATVHLLDMLGLGLERLTPEMTSMLKFACADDHFRATDERMIEANERRLLELSPRVFGIPTRLNDGDLAGASSVLDRMPLIPSLAPPPRDVSSLERRWSLAELLKNPLVPSLIGLPAKSLGSHYEAIRAGQRWTEALHKKNSFGAARTSSYLGTIAEPVSTEAVERLISTNPAVFGRPVDFSDYDFFVIAREKLRGDKLRRAESYLVSRGYTLADFERVRRPARPVPDLTRDELPTYAPVMNSSNTDSAGCDGAMTDVPRRAAGQAK